MTAAFVGSASTLSNQAAVELDDVGPHPHELGKTGVARAGVVDGDASPAGTHVLQRQLELGALRDQCILGDLEREAREIVGQPEPVAAHEQRPRD